MYKIIIIGAGFAGLSAAKRLSRCGLNLDITFFDKKEDVDFLPLIPDVIGRGLDADLLTCRIQDLLGKKIRFFKEEVLSIDFEAKQVFTAGSSYIYDFLLITSGSQTNFFANPEAQSYAYALNSVKDVKALISALQKNRFENFVICGGGYTGIEAATNLCLFCRKNGIAAKIVIVERSPGILGPLPGWMKSYVGDNLKKLGIEVLLNSVVENIQSSRVLVSGGRVLEKAMLIWVPGVKTADFIQQLPVDKNPQGRIVVDEYLRFRQGCFCAGDAALFTAQGNPIRMAVQFSIAEGAQAADNIIRSIKRLPLNKFQPRDLGFIIPMANNRSCGAVFGLNLKGFLPTLLHFMMCIYRSYGLRNKIGLTGNLAKALICIGSLRRRRGKC
ncbi:MAG: FAD-dependent oxidoreductase [Candidatus Omnitrophica bacterium]|jgi:NADH dehydrogenase|nr:FAD-dependent oxidoreductase [Candidatus Omnitrophota bacterium]